MLDAAQTSDEDAASAPQDDPLALGMTQMVQCQSQARTESPSTPEAIGNNHLAMSGSSDELLELVLVSTQPSRRGGQMGDASLIGIDPGHGDFPTASGSGAAADRLAVSHLGQESATSANLSFSELIRHGQEDSAPQAPDSAETAAVARSADGIAVPQMPARDTGLTPEVLSRTINLPVQHPRWATAVSTEIRWFAEQGIQSAKLEVTPEHLGPVQVRLSISDNQVTVNFAAPSAETRMALEQSLPRLREMLAGAGLSLGEAQVQQQMRHGSQNPSGFRGHAAEEDVLDAPALISTRLGLVDEYA